MWCGGVITSHIFVIAELQHLTGNIAQLFLHGVMHCEGGNVHDGQTAVYPQIPCLGLSPGCDDFFPQPC